MAQETVVVKLGAGAQARLEERLRQGSFDLSDVPHARFSARGEGVVATLYLSGKLVVQGAETGIFCERYLEGASASSSSPSKRGGLGEPPAGVFRVGSDEVGKGDYFGPLVVAALRADAEGREAIRRAGVTDSKRLTDERVRRLAPALLERFEHAVERLDPPEYNREIEEQGNLNTLLADLHARALRRLARPGDQVLVDRFAAEKLLEERLASAGVDLRQEPRAERDPSVAAASVLARHAFVEGMDALSEEYAVDLHKGAGAPTDAAARRFVTIHGRDALGQVAKLHFKNTKKLDR